MDIPLPRGVARLEDRRNGDLDKTVVPPSCGETRDSGPAVVTLEVSWKQPRGENQEIDG